MGLTRREVVHASLAGLAFVALGCGESSSGGSGAAGRTTLQVLGSEFAPGPTVGDQYTAYRQLRALYMREHPTTEIEYVNTPFPTLLTALTTRVRSRALEDVVMLQPGELHRITWNAVEQRSGEEWEPLFSEVTNWAEASTTPEGPYFGVPFGRQGVVWYCNRAVFERAGLDADSPPTTWEALADACERIAASGVTPFGISGTDGYTPFWMFNSWLTQFLDSPELVAQLRDGEISYTDPRVVAVIDRLSETYDRGWWGRGFAGKTGVDVTADFIAGRIGIVAGIAVGLLDYKTWDREMPRGAYSAIAAPLLPDAPAGAQTVSVSPTFVWGIARDRQHRDEAFDFVSFMVSRSSQELMLRVAGQLPNRDDIDIAAVTRSVGGRAIGELYRTLRNVPGAASAAVAATLLQKLVPAISGGDEQALLKELDTLQRQG